MYTKTARKGRVIVIIVVMSLNEFAGVLDLIEYERECLGFHESTSGLTDEEEEQEPLNENPLNLGKPGSNMPPPLLRDRCFKEHSQDISLSWNNDEDDSDDNGDNSGLHYVEKLMDALSIQNWEASPDPNHNDGGSSVPEAECSEKVNPKSVSTQVSNPALHDLLSAAIFSLLDDFPCKRMHADGDLDCFLCCYKKGFKSLVMYYLEEVKYLWENRERYSRAARSEKIVEVLQLWIYHLSEQNLELGTAYNESMKESEELKRFHRRSKTTFKTQQAQVIKSKSQIEELEREISVRDQTINELKLQLEMDMERTKDLKSELHEAQSDMDSLTKLIIRLRDKGVWDIHGLPMSDHVFQQIFHGNYDLHGKRVVGQKEFALKKREWKNEIESLKSECETLRAIVAAKDREIQKYANSAADTKTRKVRFKDLDVGTTGVQF